MMKKTILIIIFICISLSGILAQNITEVITTMPGSIMGNMDSAQKDLLVSNPEDTTELVVVLNTYSKLKRLAMSDDYLLTITSDAGTTQIKLLPLVNDSKIICVVKTVCGNGICDSQMQFYTTKWMPITGTDLFPSKTKDWFIKSDTDKNDQNFRNAYAAIDMDPMKITLSPDDLSLTVDFSIKGYLSEDDYKRVQPYLTEEPKIFLWDKISFK